MVNPLITTRKASHRVTQKPSMISGRYLSITSALKNSSRKTSTAMPP